MKLRIRGNSVRFRLSQSELKQLADDGYTEDTASFGPGARLVYRVDVASAGAVRAEFTGERLSVTVPRAELERWLRPDQVSIRSEQPIHGERPLRILVEKDFACLAPRAGEDDSDLFPNPAGSER